MGLLDSLAGPKKELEELKKEVARLREAAARSEKEVELFKQKNIQLIDRTHSFLERIRLLVGTLEDADVAARTWDLLDLTLSIKKGGIFSKKEDGWHPDFSVGFGKNPPPVIPLQEESLATFAAEQEIIMSLAHVKRQDDLAYLERRGVIPDVKIACPVRVRGKVEKLIIVCQYSGNVFSGEDDCDLIQMAATLLGLVLTNTQIIAERKAALDKKTQELEKIRLIFSRMVAPEVIQYIEKNPQGIILGGTRQRVVIFFADIRGFTQMSEKLQPEKVIELLNKYFTKLTDIIIKYKGTLDKFMGDAAMVLFGTPIPLENPCLNAVMAGEEIQAFVQDNMPQWVAAGFPAFSVGIGINFQDVVVGNVGSQRLSNFTAIGDGVNVAFRLCAIAGGGEILVTKGVLEKLKGKWKGKVEERAGITVKGKSEVMTVYALSKEIHFEAGPCPKCGNYLQEGTKFCGKCGYRRY